MYSITTDFASSKKRETMCLREAKRDEYNRCTLELEKWLTRQMCDQLTAPESADMIIAPVAR